VLHSEGTVGGWGNHLFAALVASASKAVGEVAWQNDSKQWWPKHQQWPQHQICKKRQSTGVSGHFDNTDKQQLWKHCGAMRVICHRQQEQHLHQQQHATAMAKFEKEDIRLAATCSDSRNSSGVAKIMGKQEDKVEMQCNGSSYTRQQQPKQWSKESKM